MSATICPRGACALSGYHRRVLHSPWIFLAPILLVAAGCTVRLERDAGADAGRDAAVRDAGLDVAIALDVGADAPASSDAGLDAPGAIDAPVDGGDTGSPLDVGADAGPDAGPGDAGTDTGRDAAGSCAISVGDTVVLDGMGDVAAYPGSQLLVPGATVAATDVVAITWDPTYFYATVTSDGFLDAFEPFHLYLEARTALGTAMPSLGKEYGGLTAALPFSPTHLIAVRRTSDSGTGGPYDGVYVPAGTPAWSVRATSLDVGVHAFVSTDSRTISVRVPWTALGGCPTRLRLVAHVVHGDVGNEWKDVVPTTHTPWAAPGGGFYEIDLSADPAVAGWALR